MLRDNILRASLLGLLSPIHIKSLSVNNIDGLVKSLKMPFFVIPAKAGIQSFQRLLDPGFRRGDD